MIKLLASRVADVLFFALFGRRQQEKSLRSLPYIYSDCVLNDHLLGPLRLEPKSPALVRARTRVHEGGAAAQGSVEAHRRRSARAHPHAPLRLSSSLSNLKRLSLSSIRRKRQRSLLACGVGRGKAGASTRMHARLLLRRRDKGQHTQSRNRAAPPHPHRRRRWPSWRASPAAPWRRAR